jgi:folylpolyglutamate synthase/dihydropteroate synthase
VSVKLASCCSIAGLRTGLFISPHISSFRERIQIDGKPIPEDDITVSPLFLSAPSHLPIAVSAETSLKSF